ncbi:MAG: AraC family transcriptional regulator [Polaribacter sp.]|nr:AraC family transcriptional regulator [Polaribacter sp.]
MQTPNFTDFINQFRVDFAKQMLGNKEFKNYTITAIGLEAGFNSKSSFYAIFKKFTNVTPLEFQKKAVQDS